MGLYQYLQNRIRELGDADFLAAFDDASDNEAIKIGFRLYDRYGGTPSFLTAQAILDEIYKSYQNNKLVNIKKCPNHWHHFWSYLFFVFWDVQEIICRQIIKC